MRRLYATLLACVGGLGVVVPPHGPQPAEVRVFAPMIRTAGARPALYMVWPSLARISDFDRVRESYALAAADVDGVFIPAGEAWRAAMRRDAGIGLYGDDGFHPTPQASYLSALVIASILTGRDASSLAVRPPGWSAALLPPDRARGLQESADEVVRAYRSSVKLR